MPPNGQNVSSDLRGRGPRRHEQLSPLQRKIELNAIKLRAELGLRDHQALDQAMAFALIPNCTVTAFRHILGLEFRYLNHFRNDGYGCGAFAVRDTDGSVDVLFNDARPPNEVRVFLMEEFFHLWLNHTPDRVRLYGDRTAYRTFDHLKEEEALGSSMAALVPYHGLEALLLRDVHISRIAERYVVPVEVVESRISLTRLDRLAATSIRQLPLLVEAFS
jgi:hypothetical protein